MKWWGHDRLSSGPALKERELIIPPCYGKGALEGGGANTSVPWTLAAMRSTSQLTGVSAPRPTPAPVIPLAPGMLHTSSALPPPLTSSAAAKKEKKINENSEEDQFG